MRKESSTAHLFVIGIILTAALLYYPPYAWSWVGDDYVQFDYVLQFLKRPLSAFQLLNPYFLPWYYRPTQNLWFLGNRLLFGLNPVPFYWQMVLWHSLAIALVYRVLRQFDVRPFSAVLATALFAHHGHYADVVGWNSSAAIVMAAIFSLASLSFYLVFLRAPQQSNQAEQQPVKYKFLFLTFIFYIFALLTHEESILLPLFLLILTWMASKTNLFNNKRLNLITIPQIILLAAMLALAAIYIFIQFNRPNFTIDISGTPSTQWMSLVSPVQISQFVSDISLQYTLMSEWEAAKNVSSLFSVIVLLILGAWFILGSWKVRLGLIWVMLHLGLIYVTLWQSKPNLLAGRHFYQASFGLVLAFGAGIDQMRERNSPPIRVGRWQFSALMTGIVGIIIAFIIGNIYGTHTIQQVWLDRAKVDQSAREQMLAIMPELNENNRVFANQFPITPGFFRPIMQIWYELDSPIPYPSGSFAQLLSSGQATEDYYVFHYEDGKLYNLMPELQAATETVFLWSQEPPMEFVSDNGKTLEVETETGQAKFAVVADGDKRHFAVRMTSVENVDGWLSLAYMIPEMPVDSLLRLAFRSDGASHVPVRMRLENSSGDSITIYRDTATSKWNVFAASMNDLAGQRVVVRLEMANIPGKKVYWTNPRIVID